MNVKVIHHTPTICELELRQAFCQTWDIVGYDTLETTKAETGGTLTTREVVVDVLVDQMRNQEPWNDLTQEARDYWETLGFDEMCQIGQDAMHFEYYGL